MTLNPKDVADFDQASKAIIDGFPVLWWGLYKGCVDQGFTEGQAIALVMTYITSVGNK